MVWPQLEDITSQSVFTRALPHRRTHNVCPLDSFVVAPAAAK